MRTARGLQTFGLTAGPAVPRGMGRCAPPVFGGGWMDGGGRGGAQCWGPHFPPAEHHGDAVLLLQQEGDGPASCFPAFPCQHVLFMTLRFSNETEMMGGRGRTGSRVSEPGAGGVNPTRRGEATSILQNTINQEINRSSCLFQFTSEK